jgi:bilirubin oxidase
VRQTPARQTHGQVPVRPPGAPITRRALLGNAALGAAALSAAAFLGRAAANAPATPRLASSATAVPGGTLDPTTIAKYVTPLRPLPVMPSTGTYGNGAGDYYALAARQFTQQMLPIGLPTSTVWGYGSTSTNGTFFAPACTIEARANRGVRVIWANQLVDGKGRYLPHLFTVDPTLHWTNPPGGTSGRDSVPIFNTTPGPYTGPVPIVTHLHGAHTVEQNDGYPEAWYLPAASNIPSGYANVGSFYNRYRAEAGSAFGVNWAPGTSVYQYANDQNAGTLWFHDHALGMTRVNVHAGLAGFYLIRGGSADLPPGVLPGPAPRAGDSPGTRYHEVPLMIQDRSFNTDGSIFFPTTRGFFGDVPPDGPFIPYSDVPPMWNPESFGNTVLVNGRTWPIMSVEPRRYRFRVLNACNARTLILKIVTDPLAARPASPTLPFWQIGADGGYLPTPVQLGQLLCSLSERMDVIVDFTGLPVGTRLYLVNEGPDAAFDGGATDVDFAAADPATSGQVMAFVVTPLSSRDTSVPPTQLSLPAPVPLPDPTYTWKISLNELDSVFFPQDAAPIVDQIGTINADGSGNPLRWADPVTEAPKSGATQLWEITNFTGDAHPIHIHQTQFQVVNRQAFGGAVRPPESWESGVKDTVIAYPSEYTRVKARFDIPGRYVYHCHIIDHEDNMMMRPFQVLP